MQRASSICSAGAAVHAVHTMAGNGVLVALCAASLLLTGVLCQDDVQGDVQEAQLSCFKSSSDCSGSETSEPYSACCAAGTESFDIDGTCYACAELISFSSPTYTVDEGAGFVRIEVERKVNPGTNFFFFSTVITDASAKAGIDYGQFSDVTIGLVTIVLADELSVVSGVSIFDDSLVEYNENFTVSLLHLSKDFLPLGSVTGRADVIIIDNDQVDISIMPLSVVLMEPSSVLIFSLNKTGQAVRPVHVMLDVSDPELQYNGSSLLLTFEPEVERIDIEVGVPDDVIVEATEDHMILLSVPVGETGVNLLQDTVTVTVEDNDVLDVALEAERVSGSEADGMIVVAVRKFGANERSVFVRMFTEPGTAESGVDFTPVDVVLEFLPGDTILSVEVNVSSDGVVESEESFVVSLEVPATETGVNLQLNTTTVMLMDSDFVVVTVDEMAVMVAEGESVNVTVRVEEGALARDVIIDLSLSSGGGRDVMLSSASVILSADNLSGTISISAIDDVVYEGAESLQLAITSSDEAVRFLPESISVEVNIEDTDSPQLSFSQLVFSFNETAVSGVLEVTFSAQTETSHSWSLISIAVTATEGVDYSKINTSLEFDDSNRERRVTFDIFDDLVSEGLEKFALELRDEATGGVVNSSEVEIVDNEELLVSFTETVFTVSEGEQLFSLVVNKSGVTTSDIIITINLTDFTAKGGSDYGFFPTSEFLALTVILANETNVTYALPIFDDDIIENVESFGASLLLTSDDGTIVLGDISETKVFIDDNDRLRVFLSVLGDDVVPEGGSMEERTVIFVISRDENATLNRSVSVLFSTSDGSALVSRGDYNETSVEFTFTPRGPMSFVAEVLVLDDQTVEAMEQFSVSLSAPADDSPVELPDNATDIFIMDDDNIQVDFSDIEYIVSEDEMVAIVFLTKTGDNEIPVVVSVETRTADDTAIAGSDYNSTVQPLEFLTGDTQLPLNITIVDDSVLEETESFTVRLILTARDINVLLGPNNITRVVIHDNDDVTVEFSEAEYRVREDGGSVSVRVVMSGAAERDVEVELFTEDGTATANTDYTPLRRTLVFTAGEDQEIEVSLAVLQDSTCEDQEEVFSIRLVSSDVRVLLGELDTSNITIEEDDMCGIGFGQESYSVVEELQPILSVCVERRGNIDRDISLAVVAIELRQIPVDEQALAGSDFVLMPTILTLPSVDTEICFNVTIMDDSRPEGSERFGIRILSGPEVMTFRSDVNVTITDQDMVPTEPPPPAVPSVEFEASAYTVTEADGNVVIGLRINRPAADEMSPSMQIISVFFSTADGTAKSPTDYVAHINTTVNFEQDATRATVTVIVEMEGLIEGPEAFSVLLSLPEMLVTRVTLGDITTATVTIFDSDLEEPDRLVNDTVVGDPLFVVPLHLTEDSHDFEKQPSLCYEIHGQAGWVFNLVSDHCTSVNALYEGSTVQEDLNVIVEVGVTAVDALGNCINIRVSVKNECVPEIIQGGQDVSAVRYENAGVFVRRVGRGRVRVSVPNCANVQLVMWIMCSNVSGQPQMRFDIMRGFNLDPTSHGLLGQFWNIPVRVLPFVFSGQVNYDLQRQELYLIEVTPQLSPSRQFVAEYYPVSWDLSRPDPCLYAGDQQGGRIREIKTYNDPVIEQNYRLYRTDSIFETDFRFSQFNVSRCG